MLLLAVIIPLSVHAGLFSSIFTTTVSGAQTEPTYENNSSIQIVPLLKSILNIDPNPAKGGGDVLVENGALIPYGEIGEKSTTTASSGNGEISVYIVREGDTLSQIASMFGVSSKTVLWANDISNPSKIRPGDTLVILPVTGVRHIVKSGDTIASIAKKYSGDAEDILSYNQLASASDIHIGETIVIPDGTIATPPPTKTATPVRTTGGAIASGWLSNPLPGAIRSQGIHGYNGVDLAAPAGTPILAAAGGEVIVSKGSGWNGGYGSYVVVKHSNGTQTLYAHASRVAVSVGSRVVTGQVIAYVGSTGRSTGNHLHLEVRGARNPF